MIGSLLENPLFNICFFAGLVFIFAGLVMFYFPPKKINSLYGYRTISSMKNQERWEFAQRYSAKEMIKLGALLSLSSILALITDFNHSINLIFGLSMMILLVVILLLRVESAIKTKFKN